MAIRTLVYPSALHFDYLEGFLTLSYVRRLCEKTDTGLVPSLGLYSRNDAVRWAFDNLPLPASQQLTQHLDSIRLCWPEHHPRLPDPHSIPQGDPAEEKEAFDFLEEGHPSAWHSARQVASRLPYAYVTRNHQRGARVQQAKLFRLGAYVRAVPGMFQNTLLCPNSTLLFNHLIHSCNSDFTWTSLSIQYNLCAPPHRDPTISGDVMIIQLTYNDGGEVWIEDADGTHFMDIRGRADLVSGRIVSLQGQALQFPAHSLLHATMPWSACDRVVLVAYTAQGWERFSQEMRSTLERTGFRLPESTQLPVHPLLPPVLR